MKRGERSVERRRDLVLLAVMDQNKAARKIRRYANSIAKAKNTTAVVKTLAELLCVSETTVFREISN